MKNYLPFVFREVLTIEQGVAKSLSIAKTQVGDRSNVSSVIYQDIHFRFYDTSEPPIVVKYGYEDRGYLTSHGLISLYANNNFGARGYNGWRFPKPYRLDPGQEMIVTFENDTDYTEGFSVMLPCVRADNGKTHLLHGSSLSLTQAIGVITGPTMKCPSDTSLFVYGISVGGQDDGTNDNLIVSGVQLYDGNGNDVVKVKPNENTTFTNIDLYRSWVSWWSSWYEGYGFELGEFNGWKLPPKQPLLLELEGPTDGLTMSSSDVLVTLRGSLEVNQ